MREFTAVLHAAGAGETGYWATCLEVTGANGQGETRRECLDDLVQAIQTLLELEREEAFKGDPIAEEALVTLP